MNGTAGTAVETDHRTDSRRSLVPGNQERPSPRRLGRLRKLLEYPPFLPHIRRSGMAFVEGRGWFQDGCVLRPHSVRSHPRFLLVGRLGHQSAKE